MITASRVILLGFSVLFSPKAAVFGLACGIAVGFKWPQAEQIKITQQPFGCNLLFKEALANRKQNAMNAIVFATLEIWEHVAHDHGVRFSLLGHKFVISGISALISSYMVGQYVGQELYAQFT